MVGLDSLLEEEGVRGKEALVAVCGLPGLHRTALDGLELDTRKQLAGGVVVAEHGGLESKEEMRIE